MVGCLEKTFQKTVNKKFVSYYFDRLKIATTREAMKQTLGMEKFIGGY